jgi:formate dehydrogenase major subunit
MEVTRRTFLQATTVGTTTAALGFNLALARAEMRELKIARTTETRSTCPYCSVSCGLIIHTLGDGAANAKASVVHIEGDPDHPINRGTLCPKGVTLKEDIAHRQRLDRPLVRVPGSDRWEEISWDDAIARVARHIKSTRDRCLVEKNAQGLVVNRNPGMGLIGGCTDTNEFNFLQWKAGAALGVAYRDTQARV